MVLLRQMDGFLFITSRINIILIILMAQIGLTYAQSPFSLQLQKTLSNQQQVSVLFDADGARSIDLEDLDEVGYLIPLQDSDQSFDYRVKPEEYYENLSLQRIQSGPFPALHLVIDDIREIDSDLQIDVTLEIKPEKQARKLTQRESYWAKSIFSDYEINSVPRINDPSASNNLPSVDGDLRLGYREGNQLYQLPIGLLDSDQFDLFYHGESIPYMIDDSLSSAIVYAPFTDIKTNETDSIFVNEVSASQNRMTTRSAFNSLSPLGMEISQTIKKDYNIDQRYERGSIQPNGERFVLWRISAGQTNSVELEFEDQLTTPEIEVTATLLGFTESSQNPDHFADLFLDGVALMRTSWEGRTTHVYTEKIALSTLPSDGIVKLEHRVDAESPVFGSGGSGLDFQNLDTISLEYEAYPKISVDNFKQLHLPDESGTPRLVTIGGFPEGTPESEILLLDVTDNTAPVLVEGFLLFESTSDTVAIEFEDNGTEAVYHAQLMDSISEFDTVTEIETLPSLLNIDGRLAEIYVRDPVYADELERVRQRNFGQYHFDPQAAYNAYSHGQESREALQNALRDIISNAASPVPYPAIILVGSGSYDPQNRLGFERVPQIPCFIDNSEESNGIPIESAVDYPYTTLFGDDIFPDARIARIPIDSEEELEIVIDRMIAYEAEVETLISESRPGYFIADNEQQFDNLNDFLETEWIKTGNSSERYTVTGLNDTNSIKQVVEQNSGPALLLYTGHGNNDRWAAERIIDTTTAPTLQTKNRWPIIATFTCLTGNYATPGLSTKSLSEVWLLTPENGTPFNVAPTAVETFAAQSLFAQQVLIGINKEDLPPVYAGDMMLNAHTNFATLFPAFNRVNRSYVAFGHPNTATTLSPLIDLTTGMWVIY